MNIKQLVVEFVAVFVVALVAVLIVKFLWKIIGHRESTVDWETSFRFYDHVVHNLDLDKDSGNQRK